MAIQVRCSCGKQLLVKDEWEGRKVQCPQCGIGLEIPHRELASQADAWTTDQRLSDGFPTQHTFPPQHSTAGASPFAEKPPSTKAKGGWFSWLFWEFPRFGSALKWNEPVSYRIRLRSDILRRLAIVIAAWAAGTGGLLVMFAINNNPPGISLAIGLGAVFGGIAAMLVFGRREHVAGRVIVREDGIRYERTYASFSLPGTWYEWSEWPYANMDRCVMVPGHVLGKSFSVMVVVLGSRHQLIGIPHKIDLQELQRHLAGMQVRVEYGKTIPAEYTQPLQIEIPVVVGAVCTACLLAGLGFYAISLGGFRPPQARDEIARQARREQMQQMHDELVRDTQKLQSGLSQFDPSAAPPRFPGIPRPQVPASATGDEQAASVPFGNSLPAPRGFGSRFRPDMGDSVNSPPGQAMMPQGLPRWSGFGDESEQADQGRIVSEPSAQPSPPSFAPAARLLPGDTELVGGSGGIPFRSTLPDGQPVVGFRYAMGRWSGQESPRKLEPIYERQLASGPDQTVVARDGYAVGAIVVKASQFVTGVQVVFMRLTADQQLDPHDSYTSDWIGAPVGDTTKKLGGTGAKVVGIHGRAAAVLDAVGLVMEER